MENQLREPDEMRRDAADMAEDRKVGQILWTDITCGCSKSPKVKRKDIFKMLAGFSFKCNVCDQEIVLHEETDES